MVSGRGAGRPWESVWLGKAPAASRRKGDAGDAGALDKERIVAATVRLLDAEGLAKFSMRRLAADLGVTAMSVYWYVDNKDDLLELALDQVCGEMAVPDVTDESVDWRVQLRRLALEYRKVLTTHRWVAQLLGRYLNVGPRSLAFGDAALAVMRRSGLPPERIGGALGAVFQFVYGFSSVEAVHRERCQETGVTMDEYHQQVTDALMKTEEFTESYQETAGLLEQRSGQSVSENLERDFAFALDTVIAGVEAMRDRLQG
ncbi:TetR/AcrR family transcriptional regulator [Streptomyces sp. ISL-11]|uniref:TetR/AcrR family transcriptional regulator n=1 Tax=Streptomyces sp. ISL-11 TaxID=2819174 RepID=UPI0035AFE49C